MRDLLRTVKFTTGLTALIVSPLLAFSAQAGNHMVGGQASSGYVSTAQTYSVSLNKTEIVRLPSAASAVIVGNPSIADVSVHASDTLFVIGRGFGVTNLLVLDAQGQTMMNADVQVINQPTIHDVRVFNGGDRQSYSCLPNCQPAPVLGDDPTFVRSFTSSSTTTINNSQALPAQALGLPGIQNPLAAQGF